VIACARRAGTDLAESPDSIVLAPFKEPSDLEKKKPYDESHQSGGLMHKTPEGLLTFPRG
jgi:hypothetical protein